jgi:hypothetical protein
MTETFIPPADAESMHAMNVQVTARRTIFPRSPGAYPAGIEVIIPVSEAVEVPTIDFPIRVTSQSSSSPLHVPADLDNLFARLTEQWRRDTILYSSPVEIALHPSYQQIIGFGPRAIPLILRDLAQRGGHWFWALRAITGEDPASEQTSMPGAARAWLEWGRRNGYWV